MTTVFKICSAAEWSTCARDGTLPWSEADVRDGFVHLSSRAQLAETARRHFAGRTDLWVLAVDVAALGDVLRWEPSRGGDRFPHLHGPLVHAAIVQAAALALADDGTWRWPAWCDQPAAGGSDSARTPDAPAKP